MPVYQDRSAPSALKASGARKGRAGVKGHKTPSFAQVPLGIYLLWLLVIAGALAGAWLWYQNYRKKLPRLPLGARRAACAALPDGAKEELEKLKASGLDDRREDKRILYSADRHNPQVPRRCLLHRHHGQDHKRNIPGAPRPWCRIKRLLCS